MEVIKLIRNKWFLAIFTLSYFGVLWMAFQSFYEKEVLLQTIYKKAMTPDPPKVMELYYRMMGSELKMKDIDSLSRLVKVLERTEKKEEAIEVLNRMVKLAPEDETMRLKLAVALHNEGKYPEAERHFIILLKEGK